MPLIHCLQTRIPDETRVPVLKLARLSADRMFGRDLLKKIKTLEDAGTAVSTFLG